MKYMVYTDGAGSDSKNVIGCSYIILTDTLHVDSQYFKISGMSNPTHAETIAVGLAAGYLDENCNLTKEDTVEFYIDCLSTIDYCNRYAVKNADRPFRNKNTNIELSINILRNLVGKTNVVLSKVKGHKSVLNPNSYVDRLAKLGIRK